MPDPSPYIRVVVVVNHNNRTHPSAWMPRVDTITADPEDAQQRLRAVVNAEVAAGHPLPNLAASQTSWVVPLPADVLRLIDDLTDADDCWFDHHGGCQAHGYLSLQPGETCPQADAKALLAAARKEGIIPDAE